MSKYTDMSDFEVNTLVHECRGLPVNFSSGQKVGGGENPSAITRDYCNNPRDAWPLIVENKISIAWNWAHVTDCSAWGTKTETRSLGVCRTPVESLHRNPLRAAMIVFLMMNDK